MATTSKIEEIVDVADVPETVKVEPKFVNAMTQHGVPEEDPDDENIVVRSSFCKYCAESLILTL